ncbi:hypothetical protein QP123_12025, partial [Streptococcus agalactiae]
YPIDFSASLIGDIANSIVGGVNWSKTVPEGRKALASNLQSLLISVYPVQTDLRKFFQDGFAVATHAKGAIYKNGT